MTEHDDTLIDSSGPSRRRVAQAAGWSVPLVVAAVGAPAARASVNPEPFDGLTGVWTTPVSENGLVRAVFTVTNTSATTQQLNSILFTVTNLDSSRTLVVGGPGNFCCYSVTIPGGVVPTSALVVGYGLFQPATSMSFECVMIRTGDHAAEVTVTGQQTNAPTSFAPVTMPDGF